MDILVKSVGKRLLALSVAVLAFTLLNGCITSLALNKKKVKGNPELSEEMASFNHRHKEQMPREGSLWRSGGGLNELFVNDKARRVGDIVTIKVVESSQAENKATTKTGRDSNLLAKLTSFLGLERRFTDPTSPRYRASRDFNPFTAVEGNMKSEFDGAGTTSRSGNLTAYITARVTDIMPNGNFVIKGSRDVEINNEKQILSLSGTIRPRDISPDNIVMSTYISDAKIVYSGSGIIDRRQRPGWLSDIINVVWPF